MLNLIPIFLYDLTVSSPSCVAKKISVARNLRNLHVNLLAATNFEQSENIAICILLQNRKMVFVPAHFRSIPVSCFNNQTFSSMF